MHGEVFQFSNWDHWAIFMRMGKGRRRMGKSRFDRKVRGTGRTAKWTCPVGIWNEESPACGEGRRPDTGIRNTEHLSLRKSVAHVV